MPIFLQSSSGHTPGITGICPGEDYSTVVEMLAKLMWKFRLEPKNHGLLWTSLYCLEEYIHR